MKKRTKLLLLSALIIIILFTAAFDLILSSSIKTIVKNVGPKFTGTEMSLKGVSFSPFSGRCKIKGLIIGNPENFKTESAIKLGSFYMDISLTSLLSDTIIIEEIYINAPEITYEHSLSHGTNIGSIIDNIKKADPKEEEKDAVTTKSKKKSSKKIVIDYFIIEDAKINLSTTLLNGNSFSIPMPTIELRDIGKEKEGASIEEVLALITDKLNTTIINTVSDSSKLVKTGSDNVLDSIKGFFNK